MPRKPPRLTETDRAGLAALARPDWRLRAGPTGRYELCEPIARSGAAVPLGIVRKWYRRGWIAHEAGAVYRLTDAGRAVLESNHD